MTAAADIGSLKTAAFASPAPTTMRAAVVRAPGSVELASVPLPEPKDGEVRVRLEGCGLCASNVPPWEGREWFQYPMPPGHLGHEAWGVVDKMGTGVTKSARGSATTWSSAATS